MDERPVPEEPAATISGVVVDSRGVPSPGATVVAYEEGARFFSGIRPLAFARADPAGNFHLQVSAGPCLLVPYGPSDHPAFDDVGAVVHGVRQDPCPGTTSASLTLRLPYALGDLGTISGVVRDRGGSGVPGITVTMDGVSLSTGVRRHVVTDEAGRFRVEGLLPGDRELVVSGNRRFTASRRTVALAPAADAVCEVIQEARTPVGSLAITLRCEDESGRGLAGVRLSLEGDEDFRDFVETGPDGEVRIPDLPDYLGETCFSVFAFHKGYRGRSESVQAPFNEWPGRLVLRLEPRQEPPPQASPTILRRKEGPGAPRPDARVSGTVVDRDGTPVEGADVYWARKEDAQDSHLPSVLVHSIARTSRGGMFLVRGLPPGAAVLLADFSSVLEMGMLGLPISRTEVTLEEGKDTRDVVLGLPFAVSDIALVECQVLDEHGNPRSGVSVTGDRCIGFLGRTSGSGGTTADGRITLRMLPGRNDIHAWETDTHEGVHHLLDVLPGGRQFVELRTPPRTGDWTLALVVSVVDETGVPVPDAEVRLSNMEGGVGEGVSDGNGVCRFLRLHDGLRRQDLHVSAYAPGFYIGTLGATVGAWPEGRPAEAVVTLRRPVRIRVRIVEAATGAFVPDCRIEVADGWSRSWSTYSDRDHEQGHAADVLPGEVRFRACAPGYSMGEGRGEVTYDGPPPEFELRLERHPG